ncbi:MAG: twin transmembrane helix small protein [Gammaproteobacteria bacterium]
MIIKSIVILVFILILFNLGSALNQLVRHKNREHSEKMAKALTWRISLSVLLFAVVFVLILTGVFKPHGIGARMHSKAPEANGPH